MERRLENLTEEERIVVARELSRGLLYFTCALNRNSDSVDRYLSRVNKKLLKEVEKQNRGYGSK